MSDHSSQSSRASSPSSSKTPSEDKYEIPCESDLLVVRSMLDNFKNLLMKVKGKIFSIPGALLMTNYVP